MQRIIGGILVIAATSGIGFLYSKELQIYLEKERMVPLPSSPTRNPPWMRRSTFKSEHKFCINFTNP